ncbi:MAG TPA: YggS family pyridoxal phosphate-dependent enzyme [Gemmatimonadaceae bacterium]|nr:YggS family pyridoxal phosphate-dependent enzyme [Gemmatimonadaceae bacterium]
MRDRIRDAAGRGGHAQDVTIVAVTKTFGPDAVVAAARAGLADVGENKVQEALVKMDAVHERLRWHLIGHLQRNKAKWARRFALIHAVDSVRLADALDAAGREDAGREPLDVLLQVNVAGEATKGGFALHEVEAEAERLVGLTGLRVTGVMTMAPFDASESVLRATFTGARDARSTLRSAGHPATTLSMGMSQDYEIAVEEGATMVRLGTTLFGTRAT